MLSLSKVIKNGKVMEQESIRIVTNEISVNLKNEDTKIKNENGHKLNEKIIKQAQEKSQNIILKAKEQVKKLGKEAYDKGYELGQNEGYKEGIKNANLESQHILNKTNIKVNQMVNNAKVEYQKYLADKREEIKDLVLNITEKILKQRIEDVDVIDNMILDVLQNSKNVKTFIIKCNKNNLEELKSKIPKWKSNLPFHAEFFVLEDENVKIGSAVLEKDNGKVIVSIELAFEKLKEIVKAS